MPRILITGAGGFIGSWVARRILERQPGVRLILADRRAVPAEAWDPDRAETVQVELGDHGRVKELVRAAEACIHCASCWGRDPYEMARNDLLNVAFLLTEAAAAGHRKFIYTSSVNAVGIRRPEMDEDAAPRPDNLYSAGKAAGEALVAGWSRSSGLPCAVVRPAYTFGRPATDFTPAQPAREFPDLVAKAVAGEPIVVTRHEGAQFLPVEELADFYAYLAAGDFGFEVYNAAGEEYVTWRRIAERVVGITGSASPIVETPGRFPGRPHFFSTAKAAVRLGRAFQAKAALDGYLHHLAETQACNTAPS